MQFSIIVPFYNEDKNISIFHKELLRVLKKLDKKHVFELIYVDDGSTDNTRKELKKIKKIKFNTKIIFHNRNYSQSAAIQSGINESKYNNLIFFDGDLQNDPSNLPKMISKFLKKDLDMVIGWRKKRKDNFSRKISSLIANGIVNLLTSSKIHDNGCALKILKKEILSNMSLWGDFHRLLAARLSELGAKIDEVEVNHRNRQHGVSKYNFYRVFNVLIDIIFIKLFYNNKKKSLYVFGNFSLISFLISFSSLFYMFYLKIYEHKSFIATPLPLLTSISFLIGLVFLSIGTITNVLENASEQNKKNYYKIIKK
tara:strand:- start:10193 stop:11128 length:936 start_codon:yes stop_codon:yes gene_type:complete